MPFTLHNVTLSTLVTSIQQKKDSKLSLSLYYALLSPLQDVALSNVTTSLKTTATLQENRYHSCTTSSSLPRNATLCDAGTLKQLLHSTRIVVTPIQHPCHSYTTLITLSTVAKILYMYNLHDAISTNATHRHRRNYNQIESLSLLNQRCCPLQNCNYSIVVVHST